MGVATAQSILRSTQCEEWTRPSACGKHSGLRTSSQSGGLAKEVLEHGVFSTPNTTNLRPAVWLRENLSATTGMKPAFKDSQHIHTSNLHIATYSIFHSWPTHPLHLPLQERTDRHTHEAEPLRNVFPPPAKKLSFPLSDLTAGDAAKYLPLSKGTSKTSETSETSRIEKTPPF